MAEKIRFFPIDTSYKVINDKPVILLFGRTEDKKQILLVDDSFKPYFYVIAKKHKAVKEKIERIEIDNDGNVSRVIKAESVEKSFFGKEKTAIKVYVSVPRDVPIIKDVIREWEDIDGVYEYDILFARRYLIDKGIIPMSLYDVQVADSDYHLSSKVPSFKALSFKAADSDLLSPDILAFDIETYSPDKAINPEKNPIIMVAFYGRKQGKTFRKVIVWKKFKTSKDYIEFVDSEARLIERFKEVIEKFRPDILTGYYSDGFDMPYLKKRAKKYKISLDIGLDGSDVMVNERGESKALITGYSHIDVLKFIRRVMRGSLETTELSLDSVSYELLGEKKVDVSLDTLYDVWDNHPEGLEKFSEYNLHDSRLTFKLMDKTLPMLLELVKIVGLTMQDVNRMSFSQLVEWFLLSQKENFNEIAPNRPGYHEISERRSRAFQGAFVYKPKPGLYSDIVVFDYRSLYPTIIGSHNISPGTINCDCCEDSSERINVEGKDYWFCKNKKGFIPTLIEDLITRRMRIKEIISESGKAKNIFLDARQNTLKLMANSFYGYLAFFGARWYSFESASAVTALGRRYITDVIKKAEDIGFNVLYSDTDSIFMTLDGKKPDDAYKFVERINLELPGLMELEFEGLYPSGIFVSAKMGDYGAKKKYALYSEDSGLIVKGFETVRRNWSPIAKDTQEEVLNIILMEQDKAKAFSFIRKVICDIRENKVDVSKFVIKTQLQKSINEYTAKGPHVAAAERMERMGITVGAGAVIRYVVSKGTGIIRDRVKLPSEIKENEYDSDYYINNQVIPAVEQIFKVIGYSKEDIVDDKVQKKLEGFF